MLGQGLGSSCATRALDIHCYDSHCATQKEFVMKREFENFEISCSSPLGQVVFHNSSISHWTYYVITHQPEQQRCALLSDGKPGLNPDLILLDLEKLRASATYRSYFSERKLNKLVNNYLYHSAAEVRQLSGARQGCQLRSEGTFGSVREA